MFWVAFNGPFTLIVLSGWFLLPLTCYPHLYKLPRIIFPTSQSDSPLQDWQQLPPQPYESLSSDSRMLFSWNKWKWCDKRNVVVLLFSTIPGLYLQRSCELRKTVRGKQTNKQKTSLAEKSTSVNLAFHNQRGKIAPCRVLVRRQYVLHMPDPQKISNKW